MDRLGGLTVLVHLLKSSLVGRMESRGSMLAKGGSYSDPLNLIQCDLVAGAIV